ncbi:MAG: hypothetical protein NWF00_11150 [Candidatus Bathyarchaeota archaeon]|nr:hypothetical protein [Candidatus Bathyarchaeota archaeon]
MRETAILEDEKIQVLVGLGLTTLQARAYLALSSLGVAQTKAVSKISHIARQDLYRIMASLQKQCLVEKTIRSPATYKATPMKEGISILLQRKTEEYSNLQIETEKMVNNFQKSAFKSKLRIEEVAPSQFFMISEGKLLGKTLGERNRVVERSLDVAGPWKSTRAVLFNLELNTFKKALKRGVRIRWVTEAHEKDKYIKKALQILKKHPLFEIRYFVPPIPLQTAIYDEKEVIMCIAVYPSPDITSICSDNAMFVKVALNYFEEVWNGASKAPITDPPKKGKKKIVKNPAVTE